MLRLCFILICSKALNPDAIPDSRYEPANSNSLESVPFSHELRMEGRDWLVEALTMVGVKRLDNLQASIADLLARMIPGDLVECGVWRGGASIFMRGVLVSMGAGQRTTWLYDSFRGLPKPTHLTDIDLSMMNHYLAVSLETVKDNFRAFGLLNENVRFVPGWFNDTLPYAEVERIALLRLDGDMYESTMVALTSLYPKVSIGGYVVIHDFGRD
jgi:O-methyltransferase